MKAYLSGILLFIFLLEVNPGLGLIVIETSAGGISDPCQSDSDCNVPGTYCLIPAETTTAISGTTTKVTDGPTGGPTTPQPRTTEDTTTPQPRTTANSGATTKVTDGPTGGPTTPQPRTTEKGTTTPQPTTATKDTTTPQPTTTEKDTTTPQPTTTAKDTTTPQPTTTAKDTTTPQPTTTEKDTTTPQPSVKGKFKNEKSFYLWQGSNEAYNTVPPGKCQCWPNATVTSDGRCIIKVLGETCKTTDDCKPIHYAYCNDKKNCSCEDGYLERNNYTCLAGLNKTCQVEGDCYDKFSTCAQNSCACMDKYTPNGQYCRAGYNMSCTEEDECETYKATCQNKGTDSAPKFLCLCPKDVSYLKDGDKCSGSIASLTFGAAILSLVLRFIL